MRIAKSHIDTFIYSLSSLIYNFIVSHWTIGRLFANGPEDRFSIPGQVIPKTQKMELIPPCLILSIIRYVLRVKWSNPEKEVAPSPTPRCCTY